MNFMNIDSHVWANWLEEIENSNQHKIIFIQNRSLFFSENNFKNLLNKTKLDYERIIKISKKILNKDIDIVDKYKIISGINFILSKKERNLNKFGIFSKIFLKFSNNEENRKKEKGVLLKQKFEIRNRLITDVQENIKKSIENIKSEQIKGVHSNRDGVNEYIFEKLKYLHDIKKLMKDDKDLPILTELEDQLHELSPFLPKIGTIINLFGVEAIKSSLTETLSLLLKEKYPSFNQEDLDRECEFFNYTPLEGQAIYLKRLIKSIQTNYSLSTVSLIENMWREIRYKRQSESVEREIDGFRVVFIPSEKNGDIFVKEKFVNKGAFKAVFLATPFLIAKKAEDRSQMAILQPLKSVQETIPGKKQKSVIKKKSQSKKKKDFSPKIESEKRIQKDSVSLRVSSEKGKDSLTEIIHPRNPVKSEIAEEELTEIIHKDSGAETGTDASRITLTSSGKKQLVISEAFLEEVEKESRSREPSKIGASTKAYAKEAEACLELGNLPGIWHTYKVTSLRGATVILQQASGYPVTLKNSRQQVIAYDLETMSKLCQTDKLSIEQQIVFIKMIGNFLDGIKSLNRKGMIHRDLKPKNILCSKDGYSGISDFGSICKERIPSKDLPGQFEDDPDKQDFTGTNYYIAPEITAWSHNHNWKKISSKADIWSTGIILWELLSNQPIHRHPAVISDHETSRAAFVNVGALLLQEHRKKAYNSRFPEPEDTNTLLHLIWSCTRVNPDDRISVEALLEKYKKWANHTIQQLKERRIKSVYDAFNS